MVAAQSNNLVLLENRILPKNRRGSEKRTKLIMFEMRIVMEKKYLSNP